MPSLPKKHGGHKTIHLAAKSDWRLANQIMATIIAAATVYMFNDDVHPRPPTLFTFSHFYPQSTYWGRGEIGGVHLSSQLERALQFCT